VDFLEGSKDMINSISRVHKVEGSKFGVMLIDVLSVLANGKLMMDTTTDASVLPQGLLIKDCSSMQVSRILTLRILVTMELLHTFKSRQTGKTLSWSFHSNRRLHCHPHFVFQHGLDMVFQTARRAKTREEPKPQNNVPSTKNNFTIPVFKKEGRRMKIIVRVIRGLQIHCSSLPNKGTKLMQKGPEFPLLISSSSNIQINQSMWTTKHSRWFMRPTQTCCKCFTKTV
jgi:hypothetical protein